METKKCTNCTRAPQILSEFTGRRGKPCKTCSKCREKGKIQDNTQKRIEKHKELMKIKGAEYSKASRQRNVQVKTHDMNQSCVCASTQKTRERVSNWKKNNLNEKLCQSKRSAFSRGHEWYLSDEYAKKLFVEECHYCGCEQLNGIDRKDNSLGYTPDNCVSCCKKCNYAKHILGYTEFIDLCRKISVRHLKQNY